MLPEQVVADKAEANLENGVLEIRVPKKTPTEATKHRVVEVTEQPRDILCDPSDSQTF